MPFVPDDDPFDPRAAMDTMTRKSDVQNPMGLPTGGSYERDPVRLNTPTFVPDPPDYSQAHPTILGNEVPPEWRPTAQRITDIATGANETLAGALAVPAASVANVMNSILSQNHKFFEGSMTSGDMKTMIQNGLMSIPGMGASKAQAFDQWWADVGEKAGTQALITMAMIGGAGPLVAAGEALGSGSLSGAVMKNVGEMGVMFPGRVAAADAGAVIGGAAAPQADEFLKKLGVNSNPQVLELLGNLMGGVTGASIASMAALRPQIPGQAKGIFDKFGGRPRLGGRDMRNAPTGNALLEQNGFSSKDVANAVNGYKEVVMNDTRKRVGEIVLNNTDPAQTAGAVRGVIKQASGKAKVLRDQFWGAVDQRRKVPYADIQIAAREVSRSASDRSVRDRTIPADFLRDILSWGTPRGRWKGGQIPMSELRKMASAISDDAVNLGLAGTSGPPSDTMRAHLTKLSMAINDAIAKQYPDDLALAKAKEYSTWYHDTFSRGPVGEFGQVRLSEGYQASAKNTLPTAMGDERFGSQLAKTGEVTGMTPEIEARSSDYLRSTVADAYRQAQPVYPGVDPMVAEATAAKAAAKAMQDPDFVRWQKAFPGQDRVFQKQLSDLQTELGKADEIQRSMFFNKAGQNPEAAVETLFNSGTKIKDAKMIMQNLAGDDNAIKSIKNALIEKLGSSVNWDPTQMAARLNSKDMQELLGTFMGNPDLQRMKRLLAAGMQVQTGVETKGSLSPALLGGRVIGSMIARAGGIHTIQGTSVGAKIGGSLLERLFHVVPPDKLLARALVDPNWERFLLSKVPDNMDNFNRTTRLLGLTVGSIEAGHRKLMEQDNEPTRR